MIRILLVYIKTESSPLLLSFASVHFPLKSKEIMNSVLIQFEIDFYEYNKKNGEK